jgi:hypothetical protein
MKTFGVRIDMITLESPFPLNMNQKSELDPAKANDILRFLVLCIYNSGTTHKNQINCQTSAFVLFHYCYSSIFKHKLHP